MIRPLRAGDIIAFPYLNAIGRCIGGDSIGSFNWYVPPGGPLSIGRLPNQDETDAMIDSGEIVILETEFDSLAAYHAYRTYRDCDPRLVSPGGASSTGHLSLRAERGSRVRERVNGFLKHPDVAYQHDPVTTPFRIALTATYQDREVAMAVLGRPRGRHNADGRTVELYRFAAHPDRPVNTGSWLLSRCCAWSRLEGYDRLLTYAGVQNNNVGTMYQAAGFELLGTTIADRSDWHSREGRAGGGRYRKWRYRYVLASHSIEARRPAGRVSPDQARLTDKNTPAGPACASARTLAQGELVQTREERLARRETTLTPDARAFLDEYDCGESDDTAPLVACFAYRTPEDSLVAVLCLRDHSGEQNTRDNTEAVTLSTASVQTDALAYPVNVLRGLIADACEWARLHGYATVENCLTGNVATAAVEGIAGLEIDYDHLRDPSMEPSERASSSSSSPSVSSA
ncbi:XF1762 family protein [Halobellus litoreus]|uniref:XF1762 family protein n=1 Tax=Halobellus litoreus TaxID=755310 RepID=A0ABD6E3D9_9EURY|nr:XF1762 family protein [Halobellus litoreus]